MLRRLESLDDFQRRVSYGRLPCVICAHVTKTLQGVMKVMEVMVFVVLLDIASTSHQDPSVSKGLLCLVALSFSLLLWWSSFQWP